MNKSVYGFSRRVLVLGFSLFILFYLNSLAYAGWTVVTPPYVSLDWELKSIYFTSPNEGWAMGNDSSNKKGIFLHYLNGSWTLVTSPYISSYWYLGGDAGGGIQFTSPNDGWAVGFNNMGGDLLLFHYLNGSWGPIMHPYMYENWWFQDVQFFSPNEGWVVGTGYFSEGNDYKDRGILLRYVNGSLTAVTPPSNVSPTNWGWELYSVHFTSSNEGWAVGTALEEQSNYIFPNKGILLHYKNGL